MEPFAKELEYCTYCPKMCRHSCPVSNALGNETLIPQAKMELLNMLRRTRAPLGAGLRGADLTAAPPAGSVSGTAATTSTWRTVLQHGRAVAERRRLIHPKLRRLQERFRTRNERLSAKLHEEYSPRLFAEEAQVAYFPGCDAIDSSIGDIRDALTVFDSLDLNFVRLMDAPYVCAGYPLWAGGLHRRGALRGGGHGQEPRTLRHGGGGVRGLHLAAAREAARRGVRAQHRGAAHLRVPLCPRRAAGDPAAPTRRPSITTPATWGATWGSTIRRGG